MTAEDVSGGYFTFLIFMRNTVAYVTFFLSVLDVQI